MNNKKNEKLILIDIINAKSYYELNKIYTLNKDVIENNDRLAIFYLYTVEEVLFILGLKELEKIVCEDIFYLKKNEIASLFKIKKYTDFFINCEKQDVIRELKVKSFTGEN